MNIKQTTEKFSANVMHLDALAGAIEALALALLVRAAAWVASIPTIMLTSKTCQAVFDLTPTAALLSAIALEVVGQSVVNTWLKAREWNNTKRKSDAAANERLALAMTVAYFVSDFVLIGVLEIPKALINPVHWAALLFPLGQVISTVMTGERAAQFRREAEATKERRERAQVRAQRRAQKRAQQTAQQVHKSNGNGAQQGVQNSDLGAVNRTRQAQKNAQMETLLGAYLGNPDLGVSEAARVLGVHRNTVYNYLEELETAGKVKRNGHGVEVLTA